MAESISGFVQTPIDVRIVERSELTPHLERETFSGGWNDSAKARNRERIETAPFYFIRESMTIVCALGASQLIASKIEGAWSKEDDGNG
jgi:hypothetical protein